MRHKARLFWPVALGIFLTDCATKDAAVTHLSPPYVAHPVVGDTVQLTLAYHRGAAMGLPIGVIGRFGLSLVAVLVCRALSWGYRRAPADSAPRILALALLPRRDLARLPVQAGATRPDRRVITPTRLLDRPRCPPCLHGAAAAGDRHRLRRVPP